ncbi:MAG TPA: four helix bundle protein [Chitinophagaceae bacterium]|nr:four helix bundle protein [Chitinophagaceae bacterium]
MNGEKSLFNWVIHFAANRLSVTFSKSSAVFLKLNHQKLDVYSASLGLVFVCYKFSMTLPSEKKFGMSSQIRRAALSVHLNIAEGASRKSVVERRRYYEIARGSIVEIDAALDVANELGYTKDQDISDLSKAMIRYFQVLSGMLR